MDESQINAIIEAVIKELGAAKAGSIPPPVASPASIPASSTLPTGISNSLISNLQSLVIDLPDPTLPAHRYKPRVTNAQKPDSLPALIASTTSRIGVGRAGPHYNTFSLLLFQGDHAITQDALMRDVDQKLLDDLDLFTVQTNITGGKQEYLLRPDLGRQLSDEAKKTLAEKCVKSPNIQLVVGDGLSAAAVEANAREMFPVIMNGAKQAGLTVGTPFFIKYCRVGVLNDIGEALKPDIDILLIG